MSVSPTSLMPLDPALSPQHVNRVLPIRADLLPEEIMAARNARRTRVFLIGAVALTLVVLAGWFLYADKQRDLVNEDLASTTQQVDTVRAETRKDAYAKVTDTKSDKTAIDNELKIALVKDLPWATMLDAISLTAAARNVTLTTVVANLSEDQASVATTDVIGSLSISGTAADKKTIAAFVDALSDVHAVDDAYPTAANQGDGNWTFSLTADITKDALCGRFTTACKGGGN